MKKLLTVLFTLLMLFSLVACNKKENEPEPEPTPTPTEIKPDEKPDEKQEEDPLKKFYGLWADEIAGRGNLVISAEGAGITWSGSASEMGIWGLPIVYNKENDSLDYEGAVYSVIKYNEQGTYTQDIEYEDGRGSLEYKEDKLIWHNEKGENDGTIFIKVSDEVDIYNPWEYSDDITKAEVKAGFKFSVPDENSLPNGYKLKQYGGMEGVIDAQYESENAYLYLKKSKRYKDRELSGNYNAYPHNWEMTIKGATVKCEGYIEGKIDQAYINTDENHYSIMVQGKKPSDKETVGLTPQEVTSIVNSIQ